MTTYNLSPSDLTFLYNECPSCFRAKVLKLWKRPYQAFPSIFNKIDRCMRDCYSGMNPKLINGSLPDGVIDTSSKKVKSKPIPVELNGETHEIVLSGKMDALALFANGDVGVIDFKTSDTKDEHLSLYSRQLHAYRQILASTEEVSRLGLICATPEVMKPCSDNAAIFEMRITWKEVAIDLPWWYDFLKQVVSVLENPRINQECFYCRASLNS